ncbi:DUF4199 domain-containing protein [Flavobacterium beibuense]|uniref:50S ribosomal protein L31 type B n=1 Tax=Flavobacterium beibuense TaxID=657326 RepID=A0A444WIV5_9FLAO|nr:DUF4199 domain-containing protein [Flavobacterium beibuense]RYJ45767.1 50S ribosomal protein L31 type B [Flavobacterium beibuense]
MEQENNILEKKISPAKSATSYGIVFGSIMILEFVLMYVLKPDPIKSGWVGTFTNVLNFCILPIIFISLGCNNYKKNINGGYISFSQCLKLGVSITVLAAFIYSVFYFIFWLIFPEFITEFIETMKTVTVHQRPNISSEELQMSMSIIEKTMLPYISGPLTIVMHAFLGLIWSLLVGAFVKKDNPGAL